jgi:transcriptional antiterminator NusG
VPDEPFTSTEPSAEALDTEMVRVENAAGEAQELPPSQEQADRPDAITPQPAVEAQEAYGIEPPSAEPGDERGEQELPGLPAAEQPVDDVAPAEPVAVEATLPPQEEASVQSDEVPAEPAASLEPDAAEQVADLAAAAPAETTEETVAAEKAPTAKKRAAKTSKQEDAEPAPPPERSNNMDWYILKVQSNREESIRDGLLRRVAIAGLDYYFGEVIIPTEKVTEFKGGKKKVTKRKLYPGYIVVQMEVNDDTWFLVRDTPGIGDFTGAAGTPTPMLPHEVSRILARQEEKADAAPKLKIGFNVGDRVKVTEGNFENFEGEVHTIDQTNGRVTVMINIFGRSTPVELEYWQIETV